MDGPTLVDLGARYGTAKAGHGYLAEYDRLFAPFRAEAFALLEIGVYQGASVRMWHDYFPRARIVGLDLRPDPGLDLPRYAHVVGDQADAGLLERLAAEHAFRVVIDDGSHRWRHQAATFAALFPRLAPGGIYVCEDLHTSFGGIARRYRGGAAESGADYFLRLARHAVAGGAEPPPDDLAPLLRRVRRVSFVRHAAVVHAA